MWFVSFTSFKDGGQPYAGVDLLQNCRVELPQLYCIYVYML